MSSSPSLLLDLLLTISYLQTLMGARGETR